MKNSEYAIDICTIENSQTIISEFNQVRESYYQKVRTTFLRGSVASIIIAVLIVVAMWGIKALVKKDVVETVLLIVSIGVDIVFTIATGFLVLMNLL